MVDFIFIEFKKIPGFNLEPTRVNSGKIAKHKQILINFWKNKEILIYLLLYTSNFKSTTNWFYFYLFIYFSFSIFVFLSVFLFQFFLSIFPFLLFQFFFFFFLFFNFFLFFLPFFIFFFLSFFPLLLPSYRIIIFFNNFLLFDFPKVVLSNNAVFEKVCFLMKLFP